MPTVGTVTTPLGRGRDAAPHADRAHTGTARAQIEIAPGPRLCPLPQGSTLLRMLHGRSHRAQARVVATCLRRSLAAPTRTPCPLPWGSTPCLPGSARAGTPEIAGRAGTGRAGPAGTGSGEDLDHVLAALLRLSRSFASPRRSFASPLVPSGLLGHGDRLR
jgi:hypothetical protein